MFPRFFVVGAQKAGTTSLDSYLRQHPGIYLPPGKETKFFVRDDRYSQGLDYYHQHWFGEAEPFQLVGEVDPDYMYYEVALERIARVANLEELKFIFLFREPVSRAFSHYLMSFRRGHETLSFEEAIEREPDRIKRGYFEKNRFSYLDRGYYFRQVTRFIEKGVDKNQLLCLLSEDLERNPFGTMSETFKFLGLPNIRHSSFAEKRFSATVPKNMTVLRALTSEGVHKKALRLLLPVPRARAALRRKLTSWNESSSVHITLCDSTRDKLRAMYRLENEKLADLIDKDLSGWN